MPVERFKPGIFWVEDIILYLNIKQQMFPDKKAKT